MTELPKLGGILEAGLYVSDLDQAEAFYRDTLGFEQISRREGRSAFFRCGNALVLTFIAEATRDPASSGDFPVPTHGSDGEGHICFSVPDSATLDQWVQRLTSEGIEIESDFLWPNGARSVYVRDPAGNSVEFAEPKLWGIAYG